ncbi:MAG: YaiI/YqxD family protein [Candidatus Marinimicrobia bacterium]|nr:YaiI/YqxD family protein [Candidatus Neomarinimicrobiota bacterium]
MLHVYIDADACPVKPEIYKVAHRYKLQVTVVANSWMRVPQGQNIKLEVVGDGFDEADDWIVEHVEAQDIVITADIPLASRCLTAGAEVLGTTGKRFTEDSIGQTLATRDLLAELRSAGEITGGPAPITQRNRSEFLQKLDLVVQSIQREQK